MLNGDARRAVAAAAASASTYQIISKTVKVTVPCTVAGEPTDGWSVTV